MQCVEVPAAMSTVQVLAQREKKLNKKKEQIAAISSQVIEDPQANVNNLTPVTYYYIKLIFLQH